MATRFYIVPNDGTDISPTFGAFADTAQATRRYMTIGKFGPQELRSGTLTGAAANNALICQAISPPLAAQTISGTYNINMYGRELDVADNINQFVYRLFVVDASGVFRFNLTGLTSITITELNTVLGTINGVNGATVTTQTVNQFDRIVLEWGLGETATGTTPQWQIGLGGTGIDVVAVPNDTTGSVPWIEFTNNIVLNGPISTVVNTGSKNYIYNTLLGPGSDYLALFRLKPGESVSTFITNWQISNTGAYPQGLVRPQGPIVDPIYGWGTATSNGWAYWVDSEAPQDTPLSYVAWDPINNLFYAAVTSPATGTSATIARSAAGTVTEQGTGGTTSFTVNYPPTTVLNEVLILDLGSSGGTPTTPAGWTLIAGSQQAAADSSYGYWKVATGAEGGTSFVATLATAGRATSVITRYTNVDTTTPIDATPTTASQASSATLTLPSQTTVTDKAFLISGVCGNAAVGLTWTQPPGWTTPVTSTGTGKGAAYSDGVVVTPPGATGTQTWGWSTTSNIDGWMAALRPQIVTPAGPANLLYLPTSEAFWLRDPQNPALDLPLYNFTPTSSDCLPVNGLYFANMGDETYTNQGNLQQIDDSPYPVLGVRTRTAKASTLTVVARTFKSRDALLQLLASGNPLMFQAPAQYGIPDMWLAALDVPVQRPLSDHRRQFRVFTIGFQQIERPVGTGSGGPRQLWSDTSASTFPYQTWAQVGAANITTRNLLTLAF